ncbi:serine/threonine protein kinase [Myxococcus xanthus]|uniref:non-specific serine/threonine protein kinase n=1 Tax=Myxococcus xanthus TaxID=34 RepID=A0AAE6FYA4_MYXXA|nr:serine/threonine-protein kinase [Myxococcus xanthus]QDE67414.1 serine/threonine protein kinase [Myxococcus xanthus]QDE74690.1 serine/threonine protein kinase [Myxococcus xanthus]
MSRSSLVETVLGQKYRLRQRIGVGGMGTVYEAEQLDVGRTVAVKVLRQHLLGEPAVHARFRREAQATAGVKHPNIVEVMGFHDAPDEPPFLVMELLRGQTLKSLMKKEGPLPVGRAAAIAHQLATALVAAHQAGVIHRDIKPDNIFLVDTGTEALQVKLLDFGVARLMHEDDATALGTESGAWVGTPSYMAPEQIRCRPVDGRADIYSLGACLYQMVTGQRPIDVADNVALLSAVLHNVPAPLSGVRTDVPDGFSQVVERTLKKDPAARYADSHELAQALEPWIHTASVATPSAPPPEVTSAVPTEPASTALAPSTPVAAEHVATPHTPGPQPVLAAAEHVVTPHTRSRLQTVLMVASALAVGLAATGGLVLTASGMTPSEELARLRVVELPRLTENGAAAPAPHGYSDGSIAESIEGRLPALDNCYARIGEDAACRQDTYALVYSPQGIVLGARMHPPQPIPLAQCINKVLRGLALGKPREAIAGTATVLLRRE